MNYDILLLGATTLACAWAEKSAARGKKIAVLEEMSLVGYDYAEAWKSEPVTEDRCPEEAKELYAEIKYRDAVNPCGIFHLPALAPILCKRLKESGADCFFYSHIRAIQRDENGFVVTASTVGGNFSITVGCIVDTTAEFSSHNLFGEEKPKVKSRSLSFCMTHTEMPHNFSFHAGCFGEADYASFEMKEGETYSAALCRLVDMWKAHPEYFGHAQLINPASYPMLVPEEILRAFSCDAIWAPSCAYADPMQAYAAGCKLEKEAFGGAPARLRALPQIDDGEVDLLVAGLGTAGAVAAIYGAKRGLKVLGIENMGVPGGQCTAGEVRYYYQGQYKNGFYREVDKYQQPCIDISVRHPANAGGIAKLYALETVFRESGVQAVYHAFACDALTDGKKVIGLGYLSEDGYHTVHAKQTIDATADGVICCAAGCEMMGGREADNHFTPFSSVQSKFFAKECIYGVKYTDCGVINQYHAAEYAEAILAANCDKYHLLDSYGAFAENRKISPAEQNSQEETPIYMGTAPLTGLREGKRIVGEETATLKDFLFGKFCDKPMFYMFSNMDAHNKDFAFEQEITREWLGICAMWGWDLKVPLPAGILIPQGWEGLLVAGRHLSCDQGLSLGLRMMDDMCRTAEAAVLMAEYAIRTKDSAKNMPYEQLRQGMMTYGALLPDDKPAIVRRNSPESYREGAAIWETDPKEIRAALAGDCYGYAMWSARLLGEKIRADMAGWLKEENEKLRLHTAIAMAMCGFSEGAPCLLEHLKQPTSYISKTSVYFMPPRDMAVIASCGRLGLKQAVPKLMEYFSDLNCTDDITVPQDKLLRNREDFQFQYRSFAFTALMDIMNQRKDIAEAIWEDIRRVLSDPQFSLSTTMNGDPILRSDVTATVRKLWNERFPEWKV